ncbi:proton channel OtopLc-like isoform X2 [Sitodiplosis mosellana]|uniref:proton channel OtopLc-like isoform X2 n=1 Tax=Sitodiplosis mosellana TaxID=263140 RepID=UPI00244425A3|nr:proton channel OtopLc-like isoform X2 [Sitodiplosis mosellana]
MNFTSNRIMPYTDYNFVNSSKLFNVKLNSLQNINRTLQSISHDGIHENKRYIKPPTYQQFDRFENAFVDDTSTSFWHKRYFNENDANLRDDFIPNSRKVIGTTGELQNSMNAPRIENGQLWNAKPLTTVRGFPELTTMNQLDDGGNRNDAEDSTNNERRKLARRYFVTVFSICYAIFLVVFGAIVFIGDVVDSQYPLPQVFCIYMLLMAFAYFLYLYIDIRCYVYRAKNQLKRRLERKKLIDAHIIKKLNADGPINFNESREKQAVYAQAARELNLPSIEEDLSHKYCFISGRNGGSLYIKLGALWFAFGLVLYFVLQITYDAYFISSNGDYLYDCASYITLSMNILFPLYSLFSLFFIVKYMNVVINVNQNVARIFIMHAIGTSLALWVFTIIRETADAIAKSDAEISAMFRVAQPNESFDFVYNDCGKSNALNAVHRQFAPYLYPFVIEYCILLVGIWCKIYLSMNQCPRKTVNTSCDETEAPSSQQDSSTIYLPERYENTSEHDKDIETVSHVYADCQSSYHGIFVGLLLAIMTIVFIIVMFVGFQNRIYLKTSITINDIFECTVLTILTVATLIAYSQTIKLDIIFDPGLKMDDILLLIAVPAFFMEFLFSLAAAIHIGAVLSACVSICRIVQVLIQTPFIIDGKRRCSKSAFLQKKKIGQGFVIFLAMANMSFWIYNTFSGKSHYTDDERYTYYGYKLWNILNHISLPLMMFYRFHASVCLVDIWNHAYKTLPNHQ